MISAPQTQLLVDKFSLRYNDKVVGHFQVMEVGVNTKEGSIPVELVDGYLDCKLIPEDGDLTNNVITGWSIYCPSLLLNKVQINQCVRGETIGNKTLVPSIKADWLIC